MINLQFQNGQEIVLTDIDMGNTYPGIESGFALFRLANVGDEDVVVQVYADESYQQNGSADETYNGTWFSLNNFNYQKRIYTPIVQDGFVEIYMKWRPTNVARTGDKQWRVRWRVEESNTENICDGT